MLNIEKYQKEIKKEVEGGLSVSCAIHTVTNGSKDCNGIGCHECRVKGLEWVLEEYVEPIKLTYFEYDLLTTIDANIPFNENARNNRMMKLGYFKGVTDTSLMMKEILENCEVMKDET